MPWTAPFTAVPGQMMTAALWNVQVRDNLGILKTSIADDGRVSGELLTNRETVVPLAIAAGVVAIDLTLANAFYLLLTANVTALNVTGWVASTAKTIAVRLTQDTTGGRTVAFPGLPVWHWSGNAAPIVTPTPSATDILTLYSDNGGATVFPSLYTANA